MKLIYILVALCLIGCSKKEVATFEIPVSDCTRTVTGNIRVDTYTDNTCFSYDKDMQCAVSVPMTHETQREEAAYTCKFKQWE